MPSRPKAIRLTPRRGVRDRDIHLVDPIELSPRQLVLRRQQSQQVVLAAFGGAPGLAAAVAAYHAARPLAGAGR